MSVHKRKYRKGKVVWRYLFDAPGSTRENRIIIEKSGFATKKEAQEAEAIRRNEEQNKYEMARVGAGVAAAVPTTLGTLLQEFLAQHAQKKLAPKTVERYHEQSGYIDAAVLKMPLAEITPLHLNREWSRLLKSGGHTRKTQAPRPMSAKTVRNIAGVISSAFSRAIKWGLVTTNPVKNSEPPTLKKPIKMALLPSEQSVLIESATGPWCLSVFLDMSAATGARRGEVLALRWSDLQDGYATIERSLTQTNQGLQFKGTKTERPRRIELPPSTLARLEDHRRRQDQFRQQFGSDYRADLDLIFANPDGTPLKPDSISASVSLLCRRLGLPKGASLHTLRHSHASVLLANGVDLATVSARLGHSSVRVTADTYSHALRGRDREAADRWDELMGRTPSQDHRQQVN
jgi:integrase